ncbi:MAG: tRNA dihydrouridine synthase DusB [Neisseriaceae bacterium]|jgi:tRNA-dihydrouridine synthase B|nr:MAG: tRNA dihydrouridine synthase DusB [Neisseriaceae bacterium]
MPKLVVSPMAGVTDAPFRDIALSQGADYAISEMITSQTQLWNSAKTQQRLKNIDKQSNKIIQIAGASVDVIIEAVELCNTLNLDAIEINMGCPAKKVCNVLAGSALLKDPQLVKNILLAAVSHSKIPIYLKTRLGWNEEDKNILYIANMAQDVGVQSLAIHGRTREQMYNGLASYDLIKQVKQQLSIPVFANGDIDSPDKAFDVLDFTGADGLYVGRGALGRPWIFKQIKCKLNSKLVTEPDIYTKIQIITEHIKQIHEHYEDFMGVRIARKHMKWYLEKNPDLCVSAKETAAKFVQLETSDSQINFIGELLA